MIPGQFEYHRPSTTRDALRILAEAGSEAHVLAGGHSLIPMMKLRLAAPEHLVDLGKIDELRHITLGDDAIEIGAMTTQHDLIASDDLTALCPIIRETAELIADPQVRYCGTIGGNAANGDPGNDMPALMQCLDAVYVLESAGGAREVAARGFYEAAYFTALQDGEILTRIRIPRPGAGHGYAYEKLKRKVGDYATAGAAVLLTMDGGSCASAAIALTNVGDTPLYAAEASQALLGRPLDDAAVDEAVKLAESIADPVSDMRGSTEYRRKMAGVMVRRGLRRAAGRAR